jgi:Nif-specific regulatory protein
MHANLLQSRLVHEQSHKLSLLLELGSMLAREVELDSLLSLLSSRIAEALRAERATLYLVDGETNELVSRVATLPELSEIRLPPGKGIAGYVAETGEIVNVRDAAQDPRHFAGVDRKTGFVTRTLLTAPIRDSQRAIRAVVQVLNKQDGAFTTDDEAFLLALAAQVAQALEGTTLRPLTGSARGVALRGPLNHIVGASAVMRTVYEHISLAASTDATVLLRGETGTGKGLFARAIHANCKRSSQEMVTVDCTTLPPTLVESELFGHEKGAFTGADRRVQGKVERAVGGTLFLDEIGELSLAMQSKLLRLLQERVYERVGGRETQKADVRIVAATHRPLEQMVAKGEFRQDLFYRLRVVEVLIPPLRERGSDEILRIAEHFLAMYSRRHGRGELQLSSTARDALCAHQWPGNVRELEHAIERAVVLSKSAVVERSTLGLPASQEVLGAAHAKTGQGASTTEPEFCAPLGLTLRELEARYIRATLEHVNDNVSLAAKTLEITRNTVRRKS